MPMRATWVLSVSGAVLGAVLVACGGGALKGAGEECVASSECEPGLLCDFGSSPRVCAPTGTQTGQPDAAPSGDAGPVTPRDASVDAPPVMVDAAVPVDAPPPPDAPTVDAM
jgi:hypothetical protein